MVTERRLRLVVLAMALIAAIVATGVFLAPPVIRFLEVDACLDSGGVWLESASRCTHDQGEIDRFWRRS